MDLTMLCGGLFLSLAEGMPPEAVERATELLYVLAERDTCSPAERHIFKVIADSVSGKNCDKLARPTLRPRLEVITGGAA